MPRAAADQGITPEAQLKGWVRAWLQGRDEAAARALMDALYPVVIAIVRARRWRRTAEEDVAQEVMVKFFEKLHTWDERAPLSHWMARVAANHCVDLLRAEQRRKELRLADLTADEAQALEASWQSAEAADQCPAGSAELAEKLLGSLKPEERVVIEMLDLEGRTATEVEALTGWSSVAIRVRAFRARRKLRKLMQRLETQR